jgi:hypothetical protein
MEHPSENPAGGIPSAAFGYHASSLAGSMGLPLIFSEIQIPAFRNRGIRVGGAMNADMAISFHFWMSAVIITRMMLIASEIHRHEITGSIRKRRCAEKDCVGTAI